jgi:hypothetical protein
MTSIHKLRLNAAFAATLATMGILVPTTASAATDWKGYSGLGCLSQNDSENVRRSAVNQPALANMGASTTTVYCPVVRDVAEGGPGKVAAVAVRVRNRHPTQLIRCEFGSHDQAGVKIDSQTGSAPSGEHTIQLGPLDTHNWGHFSLLCQLPGESPENNLGLPVGLPSYIINYRVEEVL